MAKKKIVHIDKDPEKSYFVFKHGIKVYPVQEFELKQRRGVYNTSAISANKWYIEVDNNGVKKTFEKCIKNVEINDSVWATINYYYKLLNEKTTNKK